MVMKRSFAALHDEYRDICSGMERAWKQTGGKKAMDERVLDSFIGRAEIVLYQALDAPARSLADIDKKLGLIIDWYAGDDENLRLALASLQSDIGDLKAAQEDRKPSRTNSLSSS